MTASIGAAAFIDSRDVPSIDPDLIPQVVERDRDWRRELDQLREKYPFFRVGEDKTVWFTRYDAAREIFTDYETFHDPNWAGGVRAGRVQIEG